MTTNQLDLLITAPNIVCPSTGINGPGVIGIRDGLIVSVDTGNVSAELPPAREVLNVDDGILLPGLIDLHAHPALSGSRYGVDPDAHMLTKGSTTLLSQGDAGARNVDAYVQDTVNAVRSRVKLAINFCAPGESNPGGRFFSLDEASVSECVDAIDRGGSHVWGISLNIAQIRGEGIDPLEVMSRGMSAAEEAGVPVMLGATKNLETPLAAQLKRLRSGDVLTYCFYPGDGSIVKDGRVLDCAWEARERGVLFDVGHGVAAFGFEAAEVAIAEGFLPEAISTDYYRGTASRDGGHDLPLVVSELIAAGMTAEQCWPLVTSVPARVLGLEKTIGRLETGAQADLCVLKLDTKPGPFTDGFDQTRTGFRWRPVTTIKAGEIVSTSA